MNIEEDIKLIKQLCVINFLELQEIRTRLNIAQGTDQQALYDYQNVSYEHIESLDKKIHHLVKNLPEGLWK